MKTISPGWQHHIHAYLIIGCWLIIFLFPFSSNAFAADQTQPTLLASDCVKCHPFQQQTLAAEGGKHGELGCLDCHPEHLPKGKNRIVACTLCHEGQPHFDIKDCLGCHSNPHKPLASLKDTVKSTSEACLSCHDNIGKQMTATPSRHAELFCTRCHDRHGYIPSCLDCHEPHLPVQTDRDCFSCHEAHCPLRIEPTARVPSRFCQVCHTKEARNLSSTNTFHGSLNCVYCHNGTHPSTPRCQDCHGLPHAVEIHSQYRGCLDCHGDAHRLIRKP